MRKKGWKIVVAASGANLFKLLPRVSKKDAVAPSSGSKISQERQRTCGDRCSPPNWRRRPKEKERESDWAEPRHTPTIDTHRSTTDTAVAGRLKRSRCSSTAGPYDKTLISEQPSDRGPGEGLRLVCSQSGRTSTKHRPQCIFFAALTSLTIGRVCL